MNNERVQSLLRYAELVSMSNIPDSDKRELAAFKLIEAELGIKLDEVKKKKDALVIFLMDNSGSMGPWEKSIAKDYYSYALEEIKKKFSNVEEVFITHGIEAICKANLNSAVQSSAGGGTLVSTGLRKVKEVVINNLNKHIYIFQFSDGDNLTSDCDKSVSLVYDILENADYFDYVELNQYSRHSTLYSAYEKKIRGRKSFRMQQLKIADDALKGVKFRDVLKGENK